MAVACSRESSGLVTVVPPWPSFWRMATVLAGDDIGITGFGDRGLRSGEGLGDSVFRGGGLTGFEGGDTEFAGTRPLPPRCRRRVFPAASPLSNQYMLQWGAGDRRGGLRERTLRRDA